MHAQPKPFILFLLLVLPPAVCGQRLFNLATSRRVEERSYLYFYQKMELVLDTFYLRHKDVDLWSPGIRIKRLNGREFSFFNDTKERGCNKVYLVNRKTRKKLDSTILVTDYYRYYFPRNLIHSYFGMPPLFGSGDFQGIMFPYQPDLVNKIDVLSFDIEVSDTNKVVSFYTHLDSRLIPDSVKAAMKQAFTDGHFIIYRNIILRDGDHRLLVPEYYIAFPGELTENEEPSLAKFYNTGWHNYVNLVLLR